MKLYLIGAAVFGVSFFLGQLAGASGTYPFDDFWELLEKVFS